MAKKKLADAESKTKKGKGKKKDKDKAADADKVKEAEVEGTPSTNENDPTVEEGKEPVEATVEGSEGDNAKRDSIPTPTPTNDSPTPIVENTTDKEFINDCLEAHNKLRAKHGVSALFQNEDLGNLAQEWANELAQKDKLHRYVGFGENVYWSKDKPTGSSTAEAWYSELQKYDFDKSAAQKGTVHFTQLVWKSSESVGIAMASGKNGYYVVANYFPPGNIADRFQDNVLKSREVAEEPAPAPVPPAPEQG